MAPWLALSARSLRRRLLARHAPCARRATAILPDHVCATRAHAPPSPAFSHRDPFLPRNPCRTSTSVRATGDISARHPPADAHGSICASPGHDTREQAASGREPGTNLLAAEMRRAGEATAVPAARRAPPPPPPPPWEALPLVAPFLDAASLAAASCVSTSWHAAFAADYLWARLCAQHYPSALGLLRHLPDTDGCSSGRQQRSSTHCRLFALFRSASIRCRALPAPRLALADVAFAVDVSTAGSESIVSFAVPAAEAGGVKNAAGLFLFGIDLSDRNAAIGPGEWRVRWTAVRTGNRWDGGAPVAVLMMDAKVPAARAAGAVSFGGRGEAGVAARLPAPGCGGERLEAEVVVELAGEERLVEKVRLGVMCECRYVGADEGLRYLQHFLL
ncbi:uncharacterized protein LOC112895033 [Panicum hallii]|nr:uncharacterized protein LOC112895033 [Panicum hallii]